MLQCQSVGRGKEPFEGSVGRWGGSLSPAGVHLWEHQAHLGQRGLSPRRGVGVSCTRRSGLEGLYKEIWGLLFQEEGFGGLQGEI